MLDLATKNGKTQAKYLPNKPDKKRMFIPTQKDKYK